MILDEMNTAHLINKGQSRNEQSKTIKSDNKKDEPKPTESSSTYADQIKEKIDEFLTEKDHQILRGQNVTIHLVINDKNTQTVQLSVVDGKVIISSDTSHTANITISFNEALISNLIKLKTSYDSSKKKLSVSDILNIQVKSDKKYNVLVMTLVKSKLSEFVKDQKIDDVTSKALAATLKIHLSSETFGRMTSFIGDLLK